MSSQQLLYKDIILNYFDPNYKNAAIATDIVYFTIINNELNILLIKRKDDKYQTAFPNYWALPGGLLNENETLDECAKRNLKEETNVVIDDIRHFQNFSTPNRDYRRRTVSISYLAFNNSSDVNPKAGYDASDVKWFNIFELPEELAFDHKEIIKEGHNTILKKIINEPNIIFPFLNKKFTIEQVRQVFRIITKYDENHKINLKINDRGNFHRWFTNLDLIIETDEKEQNVSHKPARLYEIKS